MFHFGATQITPTQSIQQLAFTGKTALTLGSSHPQQEGQVNKSRIVPVSPFLAELATELLEDDFDTLVGVSTESLNPPYLKEKPSVGYSISPNLEALVHCHPSEVWVPSEAHPKVFQLATLGIQVIPLDTLHWKTFPETLKKVAHSLHQSERGEQKQERTRRGIARFIEKARTRPFTQVILQIENRPFTVLGGKHPLTAFLKILGARNLYADLDELTARPSVEDAISRHPDLILVLQASQQDPRFIHLAFRNIRVQYLTNHFLSQPLLNSLESLSLLEKTLEVL